MPQAQTCLKLLADSATCAAELAFIQGVERLQNYGISLSPIELFQVHAQSCSVTICQRAEKSVFYEVPPPGTDPLQRVLITYAA